MTADAMRLQNLRRTAANPGRSIRIGAALLAALFLLPAFFSGRAAEFVPRMLLLDGAVAGPDVIAVGEQGTILRSSDNARTWQSTGGSLRATLTGVCFAPDGQHGWAVGHDALIVTTADSGRTWSKQYQGESLQDSFLDVLALDAQRVIAVGAYGLFAATADGGKSWTRQKLLAEDYHLNQLSRGPTGTLYLAGEHGTLLRSSDQGKTWSPIATPYDGSFYGIVPLDRRTLLAHGLRGRIYRSIDDGATWELIATPQPVLLATAVKLKSNFLLVAGQARTLLLSRDYGKSLVPSPAALTTAVAVLLETPDGSILALGEAGATLIAKP